VIRVSNFEISIPTVRHFVLYLYSNDENELMRACCCGACWLLHLHRARRPLRSSQCRTQAPAAVPLPAGARSRLPPHAEPSWPSQRCTRVPAIDRSAATHRPSWLSHGCRSKLAPSATAHQEDEWCAAVGYRRWETCVSCTACDPKCVES
jgi:hypothetical protein